MRRLCEEKQAEQSESGEGGGGLHAAVNAEVKAMLASQSAAELDELEMSISAQLAEGDEAVDGDYWRVVSSQLGLARARTIIRQTHERMVAAKARLAEQDGGEEEEELAAAASGAAAGGEGGDEGGGDGRYSPELFDEDEEEEGRRGAEEGEGGDSGGRYSPALLQAHEVVGEKTVSEEEDRAALVAERARVRAKSGVNAPEPEAAAASTSTAAGPSTSAGGEAEGADAAGSALVAAEAGRGMEAGEAKFSFEVPLERKVTWWHDKYRPRKPKYFNRVHTGYEWNKYNQTHYDHDNPPPKSVQGYKFAIFYPDLIDRNQTPTYQVRERGSRAAPFPPSLTHPLLSPSFPFLAHTQMLPDPDGSKDTCILKFKGGPPYEELAFKIVNREYAPARLYRSL